MPRLFIQPNHLKAPFKRDGIAARAAHSMLGRRGGMVVAASSAVAVTSLGRMAATAASTTPTCSQCPFASPSSPTCAMTPTTWR